MREHRLVNIVQCAHNSQHRRGINAFAQSLVVKADIAASDGHVQCFAGFGDAIHHLGKLPHDMRLLRIAEVQAIGRAHRRSAAAGHVAGRVRHCVHGAQLRIEIAPPPVAIECHRQPALRTFNTNHARIARTWAFDRIGLHHVIVLLPHPPLAADIWTGEQALQSSVCVGTAERSSAACVPLNRIHSGISRGTGGSHRCKGRL